LISRGGGRFADNAIAGKLPENGRSLDQPPREGKAVELDHGTFYLDRMGRRHVIVAAATRSDIPETLYILRRLFPLSPDAPCLALTRRELDAEYLPEPVGETAA
jgi:hypothetical protein